LEGSTYSIDFTYDVIGQLAQIAYPALSGPADRVKAEYVYKKNGFLSEVRDPGTLQSYWRAEMRDPEGQLVREHFGNDVVSDRGYSQAMGCWSS